MKSQTSSLQLCCKRDPGADVFLRNLRISFLKNSSERLLLTHRVHNLDKNVSRYFNKDIKVISTEVILVTLCQLWKWFCMVRKLWKPSSRKTYQNLRKLQGKYLKRSFVIVKPFFIQKLHIQSSVDQLRWSFFVEIVNVLKPLVIFAGELHRGYLTRF